MHYYLQDFYIFCRKQKQTNKQQYSYIQMGDTKETTPLGRRLEERLQHCFIRQEASPQQQGNHVEVVELSGCGDSFEVYIVSDVFEGKRLIERHAMVNEAVGNLMEDIHALSIRKTKTPTEMAQAAASQR